MRTVRTRDPWEGLGTPLPRPTGLVPSVPVRRLPLSADPVEPMAGPRITRDAAGGAVVRLRHHAPAASAVALVANGWWRPDPVDACDLEPVGGGWFEAAFSVPADWRATYGFATHHGPGDPPWWTRGLKEAAGSAEPDAGAVRHGASRLGGLRSVLAVPADGPFGVPDTTVPDPSTARLALPGAKAVPVHTWASRPGDPGAAGLGPDDPLPLLVLTDAEFHTAGLGTLARMRAGVAAGALPPLACVLLGSAGDRARELGTPAGHAALITAALLPHLDARGLPVPGGGWVRVDPDPARTVVSGSSYGGLTALFAQARDPGRLGAVIAQSPSLWRFRAEALRAPLRAAPGRLRLHAGRYEGEAGRGVEALAAELTAAGVDARARVVPGGHDWAWWVPEMLHELSALLR